MTVPPPGLSQKRWTTLLAVCRQMDDRYNRAEGIRSAGDRGPNACTITTENRVLPASLLTTGELDGSPKEAPAMQNDTPFTPRCQEQAT